MFQSRESQRQKGTFKISNYLSERWVTYLQVNERAEVLEVMVDLLDREGKLRDKKKFLQAVIEREKIVSTAIGMGVALPHAKLAGYDHFFIAIGIHPKGVSWDAVDQIPVRLIFMIGGPDDQQTHYLQLLSKLTLALKDEERRKKILQLRDPKDIIALFEGI